ncbi:hypothetical protein [Lentzea sp. NPDC003310]|uniref:hypothetical protein n=1 Tax=Lentzea sp. NPDC003310 TaxID=3154447 RepID=UPI0033A408EB
MLSLKSIDRVLLFAMVLSLLATVVATSDWHSADTLLGLSASGGEGTNSDIDWP